ncbi:hypothetical protein QF000_007943 [Paraburkholderia atlantica]|uniref:hypothetical protein n=1 Tax=Paraburkholderia atlantica TaxID=2654982 RepID=UPI003D1CA103
MGLCISKSSGTSISGGNDVNSATDSPPQHEYAQSRNARQASSHLAKLSDLKRSRTATSAAGASSIVQTQNRLARWKDASTSVRQSLKLRSSMASPPASPTIPAAHLAQVAGPSAVSIRRLTHLERSSVANIVNENCFSTSPKNVALVTSELITCRALAIFGRKANCLAHIYEWPSGDGAHADDSMRTMLINCARMLGIRGSELANHKVAVISGSEECDEIDRPLRNALCDMNISANWYDGCGTQHGVYAATYGDDVFLGHDSLVEQRTGNTVSGTL